MATVYYGNTKIAEIIGFITEENGMQNIIECGGKLTKFNHSTRPVVTEILASDGKFPAIYNSSFESDTLAHLELEDCNITNEIIGKKICGILYHNNIELHTINIVGLIEDIRKNINQYNIDILLEKSIIINGQCYIGGGYEMKTHHAYP